MIKPEEFDIQAGDVVQLDPAFHLGAAQGFFAGCFMIVSEKKPWGCQGYVLLPQARGAAPGVAYYRAKWAEMTYIGHAQFEFKNETPDQTNRDNTIPG